MQVEKAIAILPYVGVKERVDGRIYKCYVPSKTTFYDNGIRGCPRCAIVTIDNPDKDTIEVNCFNYEVFSDSDGLMCKAQESGYVCYHALAALLARAAESRGTMTFNKNKEYAEAAAKEKGGRVLTVKQGKAIVYVVWIMSAKADVKSKEEIIAELRQQLEEVKKPQDKSIETPQEKCGKCKKATLKTPDEIEKGLCSDCDKSFDTREKAAPPVIKAAAPRLTRKK